MNFRSDASYNIRLLRSPNLRDFVHAYKDYFNPTLTYIGTLFMIDALPSSLVDPLEGLTMWKCERSWNLKPLPTSSTKGGERGVLEVSGLD